MSETETFQIPLGAAEAYEAKFVPAIFREWAPHILDAAGVAAESAVLDVACGTGIVARTAADRVGAAGAVIGVDLNDAMLTVARRIRPELEWRTADVASLPFADDSFDAVVCQMALMFFPDRRRALAEMGRVCRPTGAVALVVPAGLETQPAYRVFVDIAARHSGPEARALLSTYWNCGGLDELADDIAAAGLAVTETRTRTGTARFESAADFVSTEIDGSPLAERIDDAKRSAIVAEVSAALTRYDTESGTFEIPLLCHVVSARPA